MVADRSYRCVYPACGRAWPRQVAFCPYCGRRQQAVAEAPPVAAPEPAPLAAAVPPVSKPAPAPAPAPAPPKPKVDFGPKPMQIPELATGFEDRRKSPPPREPIRMRTWIMIALMLAAIWFIAKPPGARKKIDLRVDAAVALAGDCKINEAKAELTALKSARPSEQQVMRLQEAITAAVPVCEKKHARGKAWAETRSALDFALQSDVPDKAASRLAQFTKKWGEDADTREWSGRIDTKRAEHLLDAADACLTRADRVCLESNLQAAEKLKRPELAQRTLALRDALSRLLETTVLGQPSAPSSNLITTSPAVAQSAEQARRVLAGAEHDLADGNYKAAMAKAQQCLALSVTGNQACQVLWQKASRLEADMERCLSGGADWINDHCQ